MRRLPRNLLAVTLVLLVAAGACRRDDPAEEPVAVAPAEQLTPEQQMESSLQRLVESQSAHFEEHGRYADTLQALIDHHSFLPVGDATVAINFAGTEPQWGYVGTAIHPFSNQQCEVLHGRASDGRPFAGRIVCEAVGAPPPTPTTVPAAEPGVISEGDTPATAPDTLPPP